MIGDQLSDGWQASVSRSASHATLGEGSPVERAAVDWEAYLQSIEPSGAPEASVEPGPLPHPPRVSLLCSTRRRLSDLLVVAPACYWLLGVALLHSAVGVSCGGLHLAALHVHPPSNPGGHVRQPAYACTARFTPTPTARGRCRVTPHSRPATHARRRITRTTRTTDGSTSARWRRSRSVLWRWCWAGCSWRCSS